MEFDIYCDESHPDLFCSKKSNSNYIVIGSLWLPSLRREEIKKHIHSILDTHKAGCEFKWVKVSPSRCSFYDDLINYFFSLGSDLRFRAIIVDKNKIDLQKYHGSDHELGFYKFYYQVLHHWILDFNEYNIFCDFKNNKLKTRLHDMKRCLANSNIFSTIKNVQAVRSKESVLIQFTDFITGLVSAKFNGNVQSDTKLKIIRNFETGLGHEIMPTSRDESKFNIFKINLSGGW